MTDQTEHELYQVVRSAIIDNIGDGWTPSSLAEAIISVMEDCAALDGGAVSLEDGAREMIPDKPLTPEELAELKRLEAAATPDLAPYAGPYGGAPIDCVDFAVVSKATGKETARVWLEDDARFYAAARNALPRLIASYEAKDAEIERLKSALESERQFPSKKGI